MDFLFVSSTGILNEYFLSDGDDADADDDDDDNNDEEDCKENPDEGDHNNDQHHKDGHNKHIYNKDDHNKVSFFGIGAIICTFKRLSCLLYTVFFIYILNVLYNPSKGFLNTKVCKDLFTRSME